MNSSKNTIKKAAIAALRMNGKPLTIGEVFNTIIENDLYRFNAADPESILRVEIRRHCEGINFPTASPTKYFQILKDGRYWIKGATVPGLSNEAIKSELSLKKDSEHLKNTVKELKYIHSQHNIAFRKQILNQLKQIDPKAFEFFSKKLLEVYGFNNMKVTQYSKDGGLDGHGELKVGITYFNVAFQCKRWKNTNVGRIEIDKFRGAIQGSYEQGIIFTTAKFSKEALNATRRNGAVPIILIDGDTIVDIMIEKRFGVDSENMPVFVNALDTVLDEDL